MMCCRINRKAPTLLFQRFLWYYYYDSTSYHSTTGTTTRDMEYH